MLYFTNTLIDWDVSDLIRAPLSCIETALPDLPGLDLVHQLFVDVLAQDAKQPAEESGAEQWMLDLLLSYPITGSCRVWKHQRNLINRRWTSHNRKETCSVDYQNLHRHDWCESCSLPCPRRHVWQIRLLRTSNSYCIWPFHTRFHASQRPLKSII